MITANQRGNLDFRRRRGGWTMQSFPLKRNIKIGYVIFIMKVQKTKQDQLFNVEMEVNIVYIQKLCPLKIHPTHSKGLDQGDIIWVHFSYLYTQDHSCKLLMSQVGFDTIYNQGTCPKVLVKEISFGLIAPTYMPKINHANF